MAPLAIDGKILVGISGGEAGIRGFVDAYHAKTGARLWRTYTVPAAGEAGVETWAGDSWKYGAGATWLTGSYDPELKLVYWGTGNPGPDWNGDVRLGDNLYTSSVLALDPDTGRLKWHFQYTPHDTHDWDANQIQVLADLQIDGRTRKTLVTANRNGFYYVLDRVTGEFIRAAPYAKQTWAKGIDARGRPEVLPDTEPTAEGNLVYPSLQGSTNWPSPSFSAQTGMFYVPVREMGSYYYKTDVAYEAGLPYTGGGERRLVPSTREPARSCGTSSCPLRRGRACSPPPAGWCSADRTRATSMRSMPRPEPRSGNSRPAARSGRTRPRSSSRGASTFLSRRAAHSSCSRYPGA
jgi:alcohol dehydrogenase (cytochrome c)